MTNLVPSKVKSTLLTLGLLLSAAAGIWVGISAYLNHGTFPIYSGDWRWFVFYGSFLVLGASLVWLNHGKVLLILSAITLAGLIGVTTILAGLIWELLALIWLVLTALTLGDTLLRRLVGKTIESPIERMLLGLPLGFGGLMLLGLLLGIVGGYNRVWAFGTLGIIFLLSAPAWFKWVWTILQKGLPIVAEKWKSRDYKFAAILLFISVLFFISPYLWASAPTIRWDALTYHVAAPAVYIEQGRMVEIPEGVQTYYVHYAEMLFTLGLLLADQPLPGWLHLVAGIGAASLTGLLGSRIVNKRVGGAAALLFFTLPLVNYEIGTAYIDGFTTLFVTAMLFAGFNWWKSKADRWLCLSGVFAGIAVGIKLNAIPFVAVYVLLIAFLIFRQTRSWISLIRPLLITGIPIVALWAPWLIRDALWTGNPVFPYYNAIFKSPEWIQPELLTFDGRDNRSQWGFLKIPWEIVMDTRKYYMESPGGAILSLPWLALPWRYFGSQSFERVTKKYLLTAFGYGLLATIGLFLIIPHARYLMPIYPVMAILAAANLDAVARAVDGIKSQKLVLIVGIVAGVAYFLSAQISNISRMQSLNERIPYKVALGLESRSQFLSRTLPFYPVFQYLNELPQKANVFSLGVEFRQYTNARIVGGLYEVQQALESVQSPAGLSQRLSEAGYDYLLIYTPEFFTRPDVHSSPGLTPEFFARYTSIVAAENHNYLYRLTPSPNEKPNLRQNLLGNAGYERVENGKLSSWFAAGSPIPDQSGKNAFEGKSTILLEGNESPEGNSALVQTIQIESGGIYTLGTRGRAAGDRAAIQILMRWLDMNGAALRTDYEWIPLSQEWKYYWLSARAPEGAFSVETSFSALNSGAAWLDASSFTLDNDLAVQ